MYPVESIHPYGGFLVEFLGLSFLVIIIAVLGLPNPICVMRLVIEHKDVLFAANFLADHAIDDRSIALDVFLGFDLDLALGFMTPIDDATLARRFHRRQCSGRELAAAARRGRLRADQHCLAPEHPHARLDDARAGSAGLDT